MLEYDAAAQRTKPLQKTVRDYIFTKWQQHWLLKKILWILTEIKHELPRTRAAWHTCEWWLRAALCGGVVNEIG